MEPKKRRFCSKSWLDWAETETLVVHAVCPQGVRTDMLASASTAGELVLKDTAIEPEDVAEAVLEAIAEGRFLVLPHPEVGRYAVARASDTDRWLGAMNHVQRKLETIRR